MDAQEEKNKIPLISVLLSFICVVSSIVYLIVSLIHAKDEGAKSSRLAITDLPEIVQEYRYEATVLSSAANALGLDVSTKQKSVTITWSGEDAEIVNIRDALMLTGFVDVLVKSKSGRYFVVSYRWSSGKLSPYAGVPRIIPEADVASYIGEILGQGNGSIDQPIGEKITF